MKNSLCIKVPDALLPPEMHLVLQKPKKVWCIASHSKTKWVKEGICCFINAPHFSPDVSGFETSHNPYGLVHKIKCRDLSLHSAKSLSWRLDKHVKCTLRIFQLPSRVEQDFINANVCVTMLIVSLLSQRRIWSHNDTRWRNYELGLVSVTDLNFTAF